MSISGIQGHLLEVSVVECHKLKDTEWISRQDPYVCLEYASTKFRTRTCTDGGKNPVFQEKFFFPLIEGLREINVVVWNSNTLSLDDFIGNGRVQLQDVLSRGYDDRSWPLQTKTGRYAGEIKLIMHYANANKPAATSFTPSAPACLAPSQPEAPTYSAPPAASAYPPPPSTAYPPPSGAYPPPPSAYSTTSQYPYLPNPAPYPPYPYRAPPDQPPYSQPTYPYTPPHLAYPPPAYPPPSHASACFHSGHYPGVYPPPPY